jgi:hypothetical protein
VGLLCFFFLVFFSSAPIPSLHSLNIFWIQKLEEGRMIAKIISKFHLAKMAKIQIVVIS